MISLISVIGQLVGTAALIIVLSVFNGFEDVIKSMYNTFNPDFVIEAKSGKTFETAAFPVKEIRGIKGVVDLAEVVEEDALFKYHDQQYIAKIKGVSENYIDISSLDTLMWQGELILQEGNTNFAVVGAGVAWYLDINITDIRNLLSVFVPKRGNASSFNFDNAFNNEVIHPAGVFSVQQEYDEKYVIVPARFARQLMDYSDQQVTSLEVFVNPGGDEDLIQSQIEELVGKNFIVKNSRTCLGIDIEEKEIIKMKKEGYNVICANVETMQLNLKFDVIIAGELIEHLHNPGLFLNTLYEHLRDEGKLILTTPNPFNFRSFL